MLNYWKPIPDYPGYEASSTGQVRSLISGRVLKQAPSRTGYLTVALQRDGKQRRVYVHRVVLLTFVGAPSPDRQVAHENGDRQDNRLENLSWKTPKENGADKVAHGTAASGERHGRAKLTLEDVTNIRALHAEHQGNRQPWGRRKISAHLGLPVAAVHHVLTGRTWQSAEVAA